MVLGWGSTASTTAIAEIACLTHGDLIAKHAFVSETASATDAGACGSTICLIGNVPVRSTEFHSPAGSSGITGLDKVAKDRSGIVPPYVRLQDGSANRLGQTVGTQCSPLIHGVRNYGRRTEKLLALFLEAPFAMILQQLSLRRILGSIHRKMERRIQVEAHTFLNPRIEMSESLRCNWIIDVPVPVQIMGSNFGFLLITEFVELHGGLVVGAILCHDLLTLQKGKKLRGALVRRFVACQLGYF